MKSRSAPPQSLKSRSDFRSSSAFTLIELLVVIAIIAILAVVVILTLNPNQLYLQARDSNRLSDLASMQEAVNLYITDASINGSVNLGIASTVYLSVPDQSATSSAGDQCQGLGMPSLPTGWNYHCAASSTFRNTDSTGWIPINFTKMSQGSPLSQLPQEPSNTTSTNQYYTYVTNGSQFQLTAHFESQKYIPQELTSGFADPATYAIGSKITLAPFAGGMVGWWPLNEGSGNTAYDGSGSGDNGTLNGSPTWQTSGCELGICLNFNGTNDVSIPSPSQALNGNISASIWISPSGTAQSSMPILNKWYASEFMFYGDGSGGVQYQGGGNYCHLISTSVLVSNTWQQLVFVRNGTNLYAYFNGVLKGTCSSINNPTTTTSQSIYLGYDSAPAYYTGLINDVRIYNRALSAAEISQIYAAGK